MSCLSVVSGVLHTLAVASGLQQEEESPSQNKARLLVTLIECR